MKKIINGRKYDTATAEQIKFIKGDIPNGKGGFYTGTGLYRKTTGEYFGIFGVPESCDIIPYDEGQAKKWCETFMTGDEYESIWGEVEE